MTEAQVPPQYPIYPAPVPAAAPLDGKLIARVALVAVGMSAAVIEAIVFALVWTFTVPTATGNEDAVSILVILLALMSPVILFSISSSWAFTATPESRRTLRRWLVVILALELACVAGVLVMAAVTGPALWLPITCAACAVVFTATGILLAPVVRSTPRRAEIVPLVGWLPPAPRRPVAAYVAAGLVVFFLVLGLLVTRPWGLGGARVQLVHLSIAGLALIVELGLFGAVIALIVPVVALSGQLRLVVSRDYVQARRIRRVIFGAKNAEPLEPVDVERARATAILSALSLRWTLAFTLVLYASIACTQTSTIVLSGLVFGPWIVVGIVVVAVVTIAISLRRLRAVRRYVAANQPVTATSI